MFKLIRSIHLSLAAVVIISACSVKQGSSPTTNNASALPTPAATATLVTYGISLRVEPIIIGNLGDRVIGPATIYVDAPGATRVEVYLMPVDRPVGGKPSGDPRVIASINHPADSYAIPWAANEPYPFVEIWAIAYGQPDVNYSRASPPMPLILQFQPKKQ